MKKLILLFLLSGCSETFDKLSRLGRPPEFSPQTPAQKEEKVVLPMPQTTPVSYRVNSLWQPGAKAFFKDQRAKQIGDILTVMVNIADNASLGNKTSQTRSDTEAGTLASVFGIPGPSNLTSALTSSSGPSHMGEGIVNRTETISIKLAAIITQSLPNGNLVIHGKQEIRVNNEMREIELSGVVRREDIMSNNTISYEKIAQARISYGGRGQLTDVQRPRWGYQLIEALSPI
jgi:flagellar L-ring protein precursor FlgH